MILAIAFASVIFGGVRADESFKLAAGAGIVLAVTCLALSNLYKDVTGFRLSKLAEASSLQGLHRANTNALIVRAVDDEAAFTLALGAIGNRLASVLAGALEKSVLIGSRALILAIFTAVAVSLLVIICALVWKQYYLLNFSFLHWLLEGPKVLGVLALVAILLIVFSGLCKAVYGSELLLGPITCNISSQSTPDIINSRVRCITLNPRRKRLLRHKIYEDDACADSIVDWLDEQLKVKS